MDTFQFYLLEGFRHISDINAYDHIVFIASLCVVYEAREWRRILILVTAFTLGHSLTLALATLDVVSVNTELVEFLIPVTIFISAAMNLDRRQLAPKTNRAVDLKYALAAAFGLIHGLGFSNFLRSMLGREESIVQPLLAFNIGLEIGQLIVVAVVMALTWAALNVAKMNRRDWTVFASGICGGIALILMLETGKALFG